MTKRLRFEIFKRDNFTCRYCGRTPARDRGVVLELEHLQPKSLGGTDDPANLLTSCFDCNRGKSNVPLEKRKYERDLSELNLPRWTRWV